MSRTYRRIQRGHGASKRRSPNGAGRLLLRRNKNITGRQIFFPGPMGEMVPYPSEWGAPDLQHPIQQRFRWLLLFQKGKRKGRESRVGLLVSSTSTTSHTETGSQYGPSFGSGDDQRATRECTIRCDVAFGTTREHQQQQEGS